MKAEKLQDAITMIDDSLILEAKAPRKNKKLIVIKWISTVAAMLAIAITANFVLYTPLSLPVNAFAISEAEYPERVECPNLDDYGTDWETYHKLYDAWYKEKREIRNQYYGYGKDLDSFFSSTIKEFLTGTNNQNRVYSPLNLYMALCMVAETVDGNSRTQILDLLGVDSIETLREQANAIWNANYSDDGQTTSILANSLWLSQGINYKKSTLDCLAENYFASSFSGEMGSNDYNKAFQNWLNEQTGGLLEDYVQNIEMTPETVLALASTIYFKDSWKSEFSEQNNVEDVFHSANGDITCEYMNQSYPRRYYWGEKFSAVQQDLQGSGGMWFILPDEGISVDDLLADSQTMEFILGRSEWENQKYLIVNFSLPKFDVSSQIKLNDGLKNLGITDVFDSSIADFSPLMENADGIAISDSVHAARVMIDEEGCVATAFTVMLEAGSAMPPTDEVDFTLDRPFVFVITSGDGLTLFIRVVNNPI